MGLGTLAGGSALPTGSFTLSPPLRHRAIASDSLTAQTNQL